MRLTPFKSSAGQAAILCAAILIAGCSSGSGSRSSQGNSSEDQPFAIEGISVIEGASWQINRAIDITFNHRVDASSVNANTINIVDDTGLGAMGDYEVFGKTVRFQPACPTEDDFSDAGLRPGTAYVLHVLGSTVGGVTVRDESGEGLELGRVVNFTTPDSADPLALFLDTVPGPPSVVLRPQGNTDTDYPGVRLEIESTGAVEYFQLDAAQQGSIPGGFLVPLNKYSVADSRFSVVLYFDQPVLGSATNISSNRITLEHMDAGGTWRKIGTDVVLEANCISDPRAQVGAIVRVTPSGIMPQGREARVNVKQGFSDLTGDQTSADTANFANMDTDTGIPGADLDSDEVLEPFLLSGDDEGSLEDVTAALATPPADWGDGRIEADFAFDGTGGPDGEFDWYIAPGTSLILNTTTDSILGGPGGAVTGSQTVINGVVDIRDLRIPESSRLIIIGPNTCTILASGKVEIFGELSVRGSDNPGVGTLNTTNLPESGASGQVGGGGGGTGSFLSSQSTPRGGAGFGAFDVPNQGGQGGEASYHPTNKNDRRGAGGGGGGFGDDIRYDWMGDIVRCQTLIGMDGEAGRGGGPNGTGAVSQTDQAQGGELGPDPFLDPFDDNNFLGSLITTTGDLIRGELTRMWAGAGGGAGGDAVRSDSFPLVPFTIGGDEKGSGGGGAAGGLQILAVREIRIGENGRIAADGGRGGGGENTSFFDRVGGGSGGGAGGHIVLSSAAFIEINAAVMESASFVPWYLDNEAAASHEIRAITAIGGQGGSGHDNDGGANESGNTLWRCDAIPVSHFDGGTDVPPSTQACYTGLVDTGDPLGPVLGAGGDGAPGIIQIHVDDPAANVRFPNVQTTQTPPTPAYGAGLDVTPALAPPPIGWSSPTAATENMVPFFGKLSVSRSKWIPLGLARLGVDAGNMPQDQDVLFQFDGVDTLTGMIERVGATDQVALLPPIVAPGNVGAAGVPILSSEFVMVFDAGAPANDIYRGNPSLVRGFTVKLEDMADPLNFERFTVETATYDSILDRFECTVENVEPTMQDFVDIVGDVNTLASLEPHFFRMETNTIAETYPLNSEVRIVFDATVADNEGMPSEAMSFSVINGGFATDITDLNGAMANWDFVRFQIEFDINVNGTEELNANTARPALRFLRVPFQF
ncbi:MAG: Ig-like domain-containing protein [bacterium]|nr:Ig-like domain-containing protein [bacterium]